MNFSPDNFTSEIAYRLTFLSIFDQILTKFSGPCFQPKPKASTSTHAHYWFYYNMESKRCEVFPYDGEVTERSRNRFEFFNDCYEECHLFMESQEKVLINDLYIKDEKKCKRRLERCAWRACPPGQDYYTVDHMECQKTEYCCTKDGSDAFKSLNECRKSCFHGMDMDEGKSSKCTGKFFVCDMICLPERAKTVYVYDKYEKQCKSTKSCCPLGEYFDTMKDCEKKCH